MSDFTPGPWVLTTHHLMGRDRPVPVWRINDPRNGIGIAQQALFSDEGVSEANARLIAAAPDLLAELQKTADWINRNVPAGTFAATTRLTAIRAAITKALPTNTTEEA